MKTDRAYQFLARAVIRTQRFPSEINSLPLGEKIFLEAAMDLEDELNKKATKK